MNNDPKDRYDPKVFRLDPADRRLQPPSSGGGLLGTLLIWIVLGVALFLLYNGRHDIQAWSKNLGRCAEQALPPHGTVSIIEPSLMSRSDMTYSAIEFVSEFDRPLSAYLESPIGDRKRYALLHLAPGGTAIVNVPIGAYGLSLEHGSRWCGVDKGYPEGTHVVITSAFSNESGKKGKIIIRRSQGDRPAIEYAYTVLPPPAPPQPTATILGSGVLELRADRGGQYRVDGIINGVELRFMLDTGATVTSVTEDFARRAGISSCMPTTTETANGQSSACKASVPELVFGNFRLINIDVMILPRLSSGDALLGMNVLRHFGIEHRNDTMWISAP